MIPFFKKLRKRFADDNKPMKYTRYAIGEIVLVVIGILIALQINNWKENRKSKIRANEIYTNLLTSLEQDSIEVQRTINLLTQSLETQKRLILSERDQYTNEFNQDDLDRIIQEIVNGVMSFFPKTGIYELITSSNSMDLLKSEKIKSLLINLYDFQYKRYENVDAIVDNKYHYELIALVREKIKYVGTFNSESEFEVLTHVDQVRFNEYHDELVSECRDVHSLLSTGNNYLIQINESINELIPLLREELKK